MPLLWFGIFSEPQPQVLNSTGDYHLTKWNSSVRKDEYQASIMAIKQAIENGDTYQANYTIRLHSQFYGDDTALFTKLKELKARIIVHILIPENTVFYRHHQNYFSI